MFGRGKPKYIKQFQTNYTLKERTQIANNILYKYDNLIPVIIAPVNKDNIPQIRKNKFYVPRDNTTGCFMAQLRKHINISSITSLFLFVGNNIVPMNSIMGMVYDKYKDTDKILYIEYCDQETFG